MPVVQVDLVVLSLLIDLLALRDGIGMENTALFLIDHSASVFFANDGAVAAAQRKDAVRVTTKGQLRLCDPASQHWFDKSLHGGMHSRYRSESIGKHFSFLPLGAEAARVVTSLKGKAGANAMIAVTPLATSADLPPELVIRLGLSPVEAQIALLLADGRTPAEIAVARGASVHTVRNQIKSILGKTGCHRQAELAVLVDRTRRT